MDYKKSQNDFGSDLLSRIFAWMAFALAITAGVAFFLAHSPAFMQFVSHYPSFFLITMLVQLAIVFGIGFGAARFSYPVLLVSFIVYAALTGVTFSTLFWVFKLGSLALTFFTCSAMFLIMAIYGAVTRADLSSLGSIAFMGLIGIIISSVLNVYFRNSFFDLIISAVGVVTFAALTAYDVQKLKMISQSSLLGKQEAQKIAVFGALQLYLDFINLFLYLLHFLGKKKDE